MLTLCYIRRRVTDVTKSIACNALLGLGRAACAFSRCCSLNVGHARQIQSVMTLHHQHFMYDDLLDANAPAAASPQGYVMNVELEKIIFAKLASL